MLDVLDASLGDASVLLVEVATSLESSQAAIVTVTAMAKRTRRRRFMLIPKMFDVEV